MRWILSKDEKPLCKNHDGDDEKAEVECLCKKFNADQPSVMTYALNQHCWVDYDTDTNIPYDEVEKWVKLSDINDLLEGKPEQIWCWDFGLALAETAIPALDHWINYGCSYEYGMTPESWKELLVKIKTAFEVSLYDLNDSVLDITDVKERQRIIEEHAKIRKEGFNLLADHWLSMWD